MSQDSSVYRNGSETLIEEGERLPLDLNFPPPDYNVTLESTFNNFSPLELNTGDQVWSHTQATDNADGSDDDVVILSSPQSFLAARKKARRDVEVVIVNDDIEVQGHQENGQQIKPGANMIVCSELSDRTEMENVKIQAEVPSPETTFICPICMDQLTEETSTRCGHIFCKECIKGALKVQLRCPTCRKKLRKRDIIRVYLPRKT